MDFLLEALTNWLKEMLVYCPVIASIKPSLIQSVIRSNRLPINQPLTEQAGKQRNQRCTNQSDTSACHKLLDPLGFCLCVIKK